jgi:Cu(I)/Ag(I) efflux system membrane fusion protein
MRLLIGVALALAIGLAVGRLTAPAPAVTDGAKKPAVWTCSMHPQVRLPGAGSCPICAMPLIPAESGDTGGPPAVHLGEAARAMAEVATAPVTRRPVAREIRAVGKVQYNETALSTVTSRVDGYIERLFVDYAGIEVQKGDHLVEIYSPELVVVQHELLVAGAGDNKPLVEAARLRLVRAGITPEQVNELLETKKPQDRLTIYSPVKGTVVEKLVVEMGAVKTGDVLYRLVNLDSVWVSLDIYEFEVPWVQPGQAVQIRAEAYPGRVFEGRVTFISPLVTEETRSIKVRVNVANAERKLKPGMFVSASVQVPLQADGGPAATGLEGQYTCPMHPEVVQPGQGTCPVCGMNLEKYPQRADGKSAAPADVITVPVTAVLDSGTRTLVYVEDGPGRYRPVEVQVGPRAGDVYPVLKGLKGDERVVTRGNFLIDSEAQIRELPSLLRGAK